MKRKVELFIQEGKVMKKASPYSTADHYGQIVVSNNVNSPDQGTVTVYTHFDHSFEKDGNGNPVQPVETGANSPLVYFFLIPMEYLFSGDDLPGSVDDAPLLAVNVTTSFPYMLNYKDIPNNRHPCTTTLTVANDDFDGSSSSGQLYLTFLFLPILSIRFFFNSLFHRNRKYFYGINDYGELTIIETNTPEEASKVKPYAKIWLAPKNNHHAHFRRIYSPKLKGKKRDEFKILIQKFEKLDEEWVWKFKP